MSLMIPRQSAPPERPRSLYFAYGSNLQLKQMAKRCPDSQFQGRARLHSFSWQINDRGFANVIPDTTAFVEGLCYLLSVEDEERLDRSEGVPTAYQKKWTEVEFFPASAKLSGRKVTEILKFDLMERNGQAFAEQGMVSRNERGDIELLNHGRDGRLSGAGAMVENEHPRREVTELTYFNRDGRTQVIEQTVSSCLRGQSVNTGNRNQIDGRLSEIPTQRIPGETAIMLVYLSQNHITAGLPWDEYVDRMNWGIIDAMDLGISQQYIEKAITPILFAATGINSNGESRGRGVRERKKRTRYTNMIKKQRRSGELDSGDQRQPTMNAEPTDRDIAQERYELYEHQGS